MASPLTDWAVLFEGIPYGAWVAISEEQEKVIAFGADMESVLVEARERGEENPLIARVPQPYLMVV